MKNNHRSKERKETIMKKLLALALTLTLVLGLVSPALADGTDLGVIGGEDGPTVVVSDETPSADGQPCPPLLYDYDDDYIDPYTEYEIAHADELANLDAEQLLADWGYRDMTAEEAFMEGRDFETLEDAVRSRYISNRVSAEADCARAEEYRADYPEVWAGFDADRFFEEEWLYYYSDKATFMAMWNLLSEEEFVDDMFVWYIENGYYYYDYEDGDNWWDVDTDEPTLTLMVNGVATDVEVTAGDGVTYADADALRQILGPDAVPAGETGPIAIRPAAEAAGWDVCWYNGGWRGVNKEVQLWDRGYYEGWLAEEFGPFNDFLAQALDRAMDTLFSENATSGSEQLTVDITRFSTLNGDTDYQLTANVDYIMQSGLLDMTVTFDVSALLKLFPAGTLDALLKRADAGFTAAQLTTFLKNGKVELLYDYNTGNVAYNIPLLALLDETAAGWQTSYIPGMDDITGLWTDEEGDQTFSLNSTLYAQLLNNATSEYTFWGGAAQALSTFNSTTETLSLFAGKDRFTTRNGKTTYSITTQDMNAMLGQLMVDNAGLDEEDASWQSSFFKAFDVVYTLDDRGNVTLNAHIRPDVEGTVAALINAAIDSVGDTWYDSGYLFGTMFLRTLLTSADVDVTMTASGSLTNATQRVNVHWNNVGKLDLRTRTTIQPTNKTPRSIPD